jgi:hypothetical protein
MAGAVSSISAMPAGFGLEMELTFNMRNAASFQECLNAINDPSSPNFHDFLTAATLAPYLPTPGEKASVVTYLEANGFQVANGSSPLTLQMTASVAVAEAVLGIKVDVFSENGQTRFYAPATNPSFPEDLTGLIDGIQGLDNYTSAIPAESPCSGPYCPQGIQVGYSLSSLYASGDNGAGVTVAIADEPGDPNMQSAINTYDSQYGLPSTTLTILFPDGTPSTWNAGWASEAAMDVEAVHTSAPGAGIILLYGNGGDDPLNLDDYVASHDLANVVSNSWTYDCDSGLCSDTQLPSSQVSSDDSRLALDSSMGVTILFASGDEGARPDGANLGTEFPSSDPNVLAVGATNLALAGCGTTTCSGYSSETGAVISGGGYSGYFAEPSWQKAAIGSASGRAVPDISMMGYAPNFWVYSTASNKCGEGGDSAGWFGCAGTSLSTPLWAGIIGIILQARGGAALGNFAPALWQLASSSSYSSDFHDVTSGANNGYSAGLGWDPVTGWGSPVASSLVASEQLIAGSIKLTSAESGAPTAVFGLSGCDVSLSSVAGDGTAHSFTATPNCSVTVTTPGAGANARYVFGGASTTESFTTCGSGTCATQNYPYYYQLSQSVSLAVVGGGSPSVSLTNTQFGASVQTPFSGTPATVWIDYGTIASVPSAISGATGEQWVTSTTSWTITASNIVTKPVSYGHQYFLTVSAAPSGGGTTSPASKWVNASSTVGVTATPNTGFMFQSWSCTGTGCFTGTSNPTPPVVMNNPITETANFQSSIPALALDGSAVVASSVQVNTLSVALSTSNAKDVIVVIIGKSASSATFSSISDSLGLTWHNRATVTHGTQITYTYYAIASAALGSDVIAVKLTGNAYEQLLAFGVSGANNGAPFDPNTALPATNQGSSGGASSVKISTSNADDLLILIGAWAEGGASAICPSGFSLLSASSTTASTPTCTEVVSSTVSSQSYGIVYSGGSSQWNSIGDAIQQATAGTTVTGSIKLTVGEAGAPTAAFGLSGCGVSTSSVPGDGAAHSFTAASNCLVTVTAPGGGPNSRYVFAGASTSGSFTSCGSGTCAEQDYPYYYQLGQSVGLTVIGGGSPSVSLTNIQLGSSTQTPLSTTSAAVYIDYGTIASVPSAVAGATGEQWVTSTTSWSITASDVITSPISYQHQYFLTVSAAPSGGGTTSPSSKWINAGSALSVTATPNTGFTFQSWSCSGAGCFSGTSNPTSPITMNNPVTETANFEGSGTGIALDGSAVVASPVQVSSDSVTLTTNNANDVIIVVVGKSASSATFSSMSDTAGLIWNHRATVAHGTQITYTYYAIASSALISDTITVHLTATAYLQVVAFGVSGANTGSPFDPNGALPAANTGSSGTTGGATISTSNADDLLIVIGAWAEGGASATCPSGFNLISMSATTASTPTCTEVVSSTVSSQSYGIVYSGGSSQWNSIGDAIQQATVAPAQPAAHAVIDAGVIAQAQPGVSTTAIPTSSSSCTRAIESRYVSNQVVPISSSVLAITRLAVK